jgi:hypothetical protein
MYRVRRLAMACHHRLSLCLLTDICVPIPFASSSAVASLMLIHYVSRCISDSFLHPSPHSVGTPFLTSFFFASALRTSCRALFVLVQEPPSPVVGGRLIYWKLPQSSRLPKSLPVPLLIVPLWYLRVIYHRYPSRPDFGPPFLRPIPSQSRNHFATFAWYHRLTIPTPSLC